MATNEDIKKLTELKELLEIVKDKIDHIDIRQSGQSASIALLKDQSSVMNSKLSNISKRIEEMGETLDSHTASLINIEKELKGYGDMYKINDSNIRKTVKRLETVEENAGIQVSPEFQLADVS